MNTYNVYFADIVRLIDWKVTLEDLKNCTVTFETSNSRKTIVYQKSNGEFYDLLTKKVLRTEFTFGDRKGDESIEIKSLVPFNQVVGQTRTNLLKSKIKRLSKQYIETKKI